MYQCIVVTHIFVALILNYFNMNRIQWRIQKFEIHRIERGGGIEVPPPPYIGLANVYVDKKNTLEVMNVHVPTFL